MEKDLPDYYLWNLAYAGGFVSKNTDFILSYMNNYISIIVD